MAMHVWIVLDLRQPLPRQQQRESFPSAAIRPSFAQRMRSAGRLVVRLDLCLCA